MATRLVPTLQEILYRLTGAATEASLKQPISTNPGRFPVVVRPETRAFLEAQAAHLGGSIAGVAGAILDGVAMTTLARAGGASTLRGVAERFNILIQEHNLSLPAAAEALADLGITLADLASLDALQLKLSSPVLRAISERFYVNYDWLAGKDDLIFEPTPHCWYKEMEAAADKIAEAKQTCTAIDLTLFVKEGADLSILDEDREWSRLPHFIPVLTRVRELPGGEALHTFEAWDEGRWSYTPCREHIKLVVYFARQLGIHVMGRHLAPADYDLLLDGDALPATVLRRNPQHVSWHPTDYVVLDTAVTKDADEWKGIVANADYAPTFRHFEKLLGHAGGQR